MASRNETIARLLPKMPLPDQEHDEELPRPSETQAADLFACRGDGIDPGLCAVAAGSASEKGRHCHQGNRCTRLLYVEYQGPDETVLFTRVNRGDVVVEAGRRVSEKAEHYCRDGKA